MIIWNEQYIFKINPQSIRDAHPYTPEVTKDNAADAAATQYDQPNLSTVLSKLSLTPRS